MNRRPVALTFSIYLLPGIWFLCFLIPSWNAIWSAEIRNIDRELLALNVVQAADLNLFSGAYSRFGFRHPGPLYFYYLALMEWMLAWLPSWDGRLRLATLLFNFAFLVLTLHLARKILGLRQEALWGFVAIALVVHVPSLFLFANYWNPWVIPLPFMAGLICMVAIVRGHWQYLPLLVGCFSLCAQSHISALLVSVLLGILAVLWGWRFRSHNPKWPLYILTSSALALVLWLPVLADLFLFPEFGNTGRIVHFFLLEERSGFSVRKLAFALSYLVVPIKELLSPELRSIAASIILILPILGWRLLSSPLRDLALITLVGLVIVIFSAQRIEGPLVAYLLSPAYALAASIWFLNFLVLHRLCERLIPSGQAVAMVMMLLASLGALLLRLPKEHPDRSFADIATIRHFVDNSPGSSHTLLRIRFPSRKYTPFVASFILESMRRGHAVCINREWAYLFGDGIECSYMQRRYGPYEQVIDWRTAAPGDSSLEGSSDGSFQEGRFAAVWSRQTVQTPERLAGADREKDSRTDGPAPVS
ncbi:MAG: hypothetical protein QY326_05975 [Bdellovibrionota bacterium]|nr:MAG: hypothetical protein QY326_05975 [Bdellovibrionota bacterium]